MNRQNLVDAMHHLNLCEPVLKIDRMTGYKGIYIDNVSNEFRTEEVHKHNTTCRSKDL